MRVWIEIFFEHRTPESKTVSPSYEGVDWNKKFVNNANNTRLFHPLMRVWIEIDTHILLDCKKGCVSPSYEGVDWNRYIVCDLVSHYVSPSYEGVDWNVVE